MNPTAASACLIVATTSLLACSPAMYPHVAAGLQMIDGDTIVWRGERWRLANHDAPEIVGHCARERELAWRAKRRLEELLRGPYTLQRTVLAWLCARSLRSPMRDRPRWRQGRGGRLDRRGARREIPAAFAPSAVVLIGVRASK
jgi:hypothetical protein